MKRKTILLIVAILVGVSLIGVSIAGLYMINVNRTSHMYMGVGTRSMSPALEIGDIIVVELNVAGSEIKAAPKDADPPGDIIVFPGARVGRPGALIVHRAVGKILDEGGIWHFQTQGDAYWNVDPGDVKETEIVGKVVEVNPAIWTYSYLFWLPIIVVGAALIVIASIVYALQPTRKPEVVAKPKVEGKFFCRYCGKENKPDAEYCEACGKKL